jgi:hypothetical protein
MEGPWLLSQNRKWVIKKQSCSRLSRPSRPSSSHSCGSFTCNSLLLGFMLCCWFIITFVGALKWSWCVEIKNTRVLVVSSVSFYSFPHFRQSLPIQHQIPRRSRSSGIVHLLCFCFVYLSSREVRHMHIIHSPFPVLLAVNIVIRFHGCIRRIWPAWGSLTFVERGIKEGGWALHFAAKDKMLPRRRRRMICLRFYRTWKLKFGIEIATVPQQRTPGTITVVVQIQAPQRLSYSVM